MCGQGDQPWMMLSSFAQVGYGGQRSVQESVCVFWTTNMNVDFQEITGGLIKFVETH